MKVKFIKDHLDNKIGNVVELTEARANYFIRNKVAIKNVVANTPAKKK